MSEPLLQEYKGGFSQGRSPQQIIDWVQGLPPMPAVAFKALQLVDDVNCTADEIAKVLSHDAALAAQVLRAGNSSAASRREHVSNLRDAVQAVGFRYVKGIVMASVTRRWNPNFSHVARMVWERSIGTGVATRILLTGLGLRDNEKFFLPGILHNLGQVVMLSHPEIGAAYPKVLQLIAEKSLTFSHAEHEILGFSHPLVGALVVQKWGFPLEMCRSILHYDDPLDKVNTDASGGGVTLKLASLLCLSAGVGSVAGYPVNKAEMHELARQIGFPEEGLEEELGKMIEMTQDQFKIEASLYS
jgi:HD-like signal output (HDOD) protein